MKYFYKKDLIISLAIIAVMIWAEIDGGMDVFPYVMGFCIFSAGICGFVWGVKYDKYDKEADVFGVGFRNRFPRFIKGQENMNIYALNAYLWLLIHVLSAIAEVISWQN